MYLCYWEWCDQKMSNLDSDGLIYSSRMNRSDFYSDCITPSMKHPTSVMISRVMKSKDEGAICMLYRNINEILKFQTEAFNVWLFFKIVTYFHFNGIQLHVFLLPLPFSWKLWHRTTGMVLEYSIPSFSMWLRWCCSCLSLLL